VDNKPPRGGAIRFDVRTGESAADDRYRVPTYEVEVVGGAIYVYR
jgi:nitrite reductase/ring-hydroxylating ferredoxin subunit